MRSTDLSWDEQTHADAGRLWAGGVATALVAAGVALVGVLVLHKMLHSPVLIPGANGDAMTMLPISAAVATLLATGLLHLLMSTTPQASQFFGWISALVLALLVLQAFVTGGKLVAEVETAALYVVIGVAIISSLIGVSRTAVRHHRRQDYRDSYSDDGAYGYEPRGQYQPAPRGRYQPEPRGRYEPRRYR